MIIEIDLCVRLGEFIQMLEVILSQFMTCLKSLKMHRITARQVQSFLNHNSS